MNISFASFGPFRLLILSAGAFLVAMSLPVPECRADTTEAPTAAVDEAHPLAPVLKMARESRESLRQVRDYEATFVKRETVGRRVKSATMDMKFRAEPFSVYFFFRGDNEGREVIYMDGRNDNLLLAHEVGLKGLIGTVSLSPTSPEAMGESRHPITRAGILNMLDGVIEQWEQEAKYGEVEVKYYPNAKLGELECKVIEALHPVPRRQFRFHMTRLYIDKATNIPVRLEQYGFPPKAGAKPTLQEEYTYINLRTNVGLSDLDFDPKNPKYNF